MSRRRRKCLHGSVLFLTMALAGTQLSGQQAQVPAASLDQLQQTAQSAVTRISGLRIDRWKTDSGTKHAAEADAESLQRNMSAALPELIGKVRSAPQDLNNNFKLYRNLEVLYDVFSRFTETAGAFGPKDDYEGLARDLGELDAARHAIGNTLDTLISSTQAELDRLRAQVRAAQQAAAAPPKKIVVDDTQPAPARRKKAAAKPAKAANKGASPSPSPTPAK